MPTTLGGFDAWLIGVAAMLGAGVFAVFGPAFGLVGNWLWVSVLLAGAVATLNAISVSWLARRYPASGAGYRYSNEVLGPAAGFLTGSAFLIGKSASVAAAALVIAGAFDSRFAVPISIAIIALALLLNLFGITATARGVRFLAIPTLLILLSLLLAALFGLAGQPDVLPAINAAPDATSLLGAAGLLFFAFAGYARIATLAGEVDQPVRTVPRSMLMSLFTVLLVYLALALVLPAMLGSALAEKPNALLALALELDGPWPLLVRVAVLLAAGASLLVLLVALSRTSEVMALDRQLPKSLSKRSRFGSPWLAELSFGLLAAAIAISGQTVFAISVSAGLVLIYYGFAHLAVLRQTRSWFFRLVAAIGLVSCVSVSASLNPQSVVFALAALALALLVRSLIAKFRGLG